MHRDCPLPDLLLDGIAFCELAAEHARDARLVDFFLRMGYLKKAIALELAAMLGIEAAHPDGLLRTQRRHAHAEALAALADATLRQWIEQLERHEDPWLSAFREASADASPEPVRELARAYLPAIARLHLEMVRLKSVPG
jgi:uncharacterized protein (TIGR02284 family)